LAAGVSSLGVRSRRRKRARSRLLWQRSVAFAVLLVAATVALGLAFAGSPARIAAGVEIAGVRVGGLTPTEARRLLERRADRLANVPVVFTDGERSWKLRPARLGVKVNWAAAVESARRESGGVGLLRGLKRIEVRVFGSEIVPPTRIYSAALDYRLDRIDRAISHRRRDASIVLRGLRPVVVGGRPGRLLDRRVAEQVVVRALARLDRLPVALPVRIDSPTVTAAELTPALRQARTAVSAPVRLTLGPTRWRLPRWRVAELLALPGGGRKTLRIGGPGADLYFKRVKARVDREPSDADFAVSSSGVAVIPARPGLAVDVRATTKALLAAALSPANRVARLAVRTAPAERSTAEARAMGVTGLVASYQTYYGGDANRIHNVQLVSHLVDRTLIPPGKTFSFNDTTGERTADRGFKEAPVIINGELQTGLGGGVCQVSTTVFNAAYEAGLPIASRTNHALYISHYPQGRDATVNYPNIDLRFVNDTGRWLLLRTWVGSSSLVVALYGTPSGRRVESETAPLVVAGPVPIERVPDPTLEVGKTQLEDEGEPPRATSVRRRVYDAEGELLYDDTWSSAYRGEKRIIHVGTKPKPKPKADEKPKKKPGDEKPEPPDGSTPGLGVSPLP
jgi:vancomycin resistance protein YoaR